jgi:glucose-6-phosphate 1-epimerase
VCCLSVRLDPRRRAYADDYYIDYDDQVDGQHLRQSAEIAARTVSVAEGGHELAKAEESQTERRLSAQSTNKFKPCDGDREESAQEYILPRPKAGLSVSLSWVARVSPAKLRPPPGTFVANNFPNVRLQSMPSLDNGGPSGCGRAAVPAAVAQVWGRRSGTRSFLIGVVMADTKIERIDFHGYEAYRLRLPSGARAVVSSYGAQVLSWQPTPGKEWLYVSDDAVYEPGHPLRGGVPICFPQFASFGPLPKHGLLRNRNWVLSEQKADNAGVMAIFRLEADQALRKIWPHAFAAEFTVLLSAQRLDMELEIENNGTAPFAFTAALHTYFSISDVEDVQVGGLHGTQYSDSTQDNALKTEKGDVVVIRGEVDRIYHDVPDTLMLREPHRCLAIHSDNFPDSVIWNPGPEVCKNLPDMPPTDYQRMLCVESGVIKTPVELAAGEAWWGRQTLVDLSNATDDDDE